jgi:hypothetical protein
MTLFEYGKKSKMMKLVERDYLRTKVRELPHMTKVHCFMNNIEKLVSVFSYIDKTFFERRYGIITHLVRLPVQIFTS